MVILEQAGLDIRDAVSDILITGEYGSDGTTESESDTGLGTPIPATSQTLSKTSSNLTITLTHDLDSVTGNGNTLREFALQTSTQDFNRTTTTELTKDNTKEVVTTSVLFVSIN